MQIIAASEEAVLRQAAVVHAISWQDSHRAFCAPEFVATHTPERQYGYLRGKVQDGSRVFLLLAEGQPVGVVTVTASVIADLYVLPERRNQGYGTYLLRYAMGECVGSPTLWILANNTGAERLYRRNGFIPTGRVEEHPGGFDEIEFIHE
jgi:GNAT superfamily N-acetyltransferase